MTKQDAVKLLQDRWKDLSRSYPTVKQFMTENRLQERLSLESLTRVLLRGQAPGLELAIDIGAAMGMTHGQLRYIALCYGNKLFADMMEGDGSPGPEMELAKRISNLSPKRRKLMYDLLQELEV